MDPARSSCFWWIDKIIAMSFIQTQKRLAAYLLALSITGMLLVYLVVRPFGPGISTDGARYLSTAQSLLEGRGFVDYLNAPLTQFPPLYSILIAGVSFFTNRDVFLAAQALNILSFGLVIWLAGIFFYRVFPNPPLAAYIGSAIFATSLSLVIIASNVLSDLLFLAFTLAFLIVAAGMLETGSKSSIFLLGFIACVSSFQRYAGLTLAMTGSLLLIFLYRRTVGRGILYAGVFGALSGMPIVIWVYFHNFLQTGILFGVRMPPNYPGNLQVTIEKTIHWFLPATLTNLIPIWVLALIVVTVMAVASHSADWKRWLQNLFTPYFLPSLIFFILYLGVLVFNISYSEVRWPFMDRIHIIILPALLALMFLTLRELAPSFVGKLGRRNVQVLAVAVFLLWLVFPVYNLQKYMRKAYIQGETSEYNLYNIPVLRDSGITEFFSSQSVGPNQKIYSNYEAAAWFLTRRTITKMPHGETRERRVDAAQVLKLFPDWPGGDGNGFVIWIDELSFKPYVLHPDQLAERASFELVHWSKGGEIYRLTPK
jgi:hypothetical protein